MPEEGADLDRVEELAEFAGSMPLVKLANDVVRPHFQRSEQRGGLTQARFPMSGSMACCDFSKAELTAGNCLASGMVPISADPRIQSGGDEKANLQSPQTDTALTKSGGRRRGRDSQESLLCLLDTHENLVALRNECVDYYRFVRLTASRRSSDQAGCPEWAVMYQDLRSVRTWLLPNGSPLEIRSLDILRSDQRELALKQVWLRFRRRDVFAQELEEGQPSNPDESACLAQLQEEESLWGSLINKVKRLYVASL